MSAKIKSVNNLRTFLKNIEIKKNYLQNLKNKTVNLTNIKKQNYKYVNLILKTHIDLIKTDTVFYIINICFFSNSNVFFHIMSPSGFSKSFFSAGSFLSDSKKSKKSVVKFIFHILSKRFHSLKNKTVALHLKNIGFIRFRVIKKLKKKFFIKVIQKVSSYSFNGCRKRKVRRKKFKKKVIL
uniref:ribosomal protein S11 n=1 Tax=Cocconeiopsis kantsiensis TaxID=3082010 RepID=UPI003002C5F8